jgi:hypothetical protein
MSFAVLGKTYEPCTYECCPLRIMATILDEKISQQRLTGRIVYQLNKSY